jgi:hypothetical protein
MDFGISQRVLNAAAAALGAFTASFVFDLIELRRAERRSLTEADQKWMASTHLGEKEQEKAGAAPYKFEEKPRA